MIAVIFEVEPAEGRRGEYLEIAASMRAMLEEVDGFLSVERFESLTQPGKLLSLSFFRDEESVKRWRTLSAHRKAQSQGRGVGGRAGVFCGYRLRVAHVLRDYGLHDRAEAPADSQAVHPAIRQPGSKNWSWCKSCEWINAASWPGVLPLSGLTLEAVSKMAKPEFAATRYYFVTYWASAVTVTYLPIWLNERGVSDAGIGLINTVPMAGILLFSIFAGRLADRASDWKQAILLGCGLSAAFSLFLGFAEGFWMILLVWTMINLPAGLVSPVADAATMRLSMRLGFSFGTTRAWGTLGYLAMCFLTGYVILWLGAPSFVWLMVMACAARFLLAAGLPQMRDTAKPRTVSDGRLLSRDVIAAFEPWVLLPVIAGAILFANHMVMNAFSSLVWKQQGLSEPVIGGLIALGAAAEAATMFAWKRINTRFPARVLILIAALASILRWAGMSFSPPLAVIVVMQLGQAVTFTFSYLGCLYFIAKRTTEDTSAEAQSLYGVMMQGFSILVVAGFGVAFGIVGVNAFWICVTLSALALAMVQVSLRMRAPDSAD